MTGGIRICPTEPMKVILPLVESAAKGALPEDIQDKDKFKSTAREEF